MYRTLFFVNIFSVGYNAYVTFIIVDSIADTYMLIEKRQVQPKGPEPKSLRTM